MGSFANIFAPKLIVIGGGFESPGGLPDPSCGARAGREALRPMRDIVRVVPPSWDCRRVDRRGVRQVRGSRVVMPLAVCATPIGNLDDVTLRVLAELRARRRRLVRGHPAHEDAADHDTGSGRPPALYHEHNEASRTAELVPRVEAGGECALVSDAGMPGFRSGARLVRRRSLPACR
jgi:hypothetical protein